MTETDLIQVLLVEDNDDDAYLISEALKEQFHITRINNGQQAYEHLAATQLPPDVILMDYRLPEMNGLEIIRELNKQEKIFAYIVLTVDMQIETAIEAMKTGALDFLPKAKGYAALPEMIRKVRRIHQDRKAKKRAEEQIRVALQEKKLLLKEVHHRTRNNMMVVSTLLGFQADHIEDERIRQILKEIQDRIKSMALVHQKLHKEDLITVNFKEYIEDIARALLVNHQVRLGRIAFRFDTEPTLITIDSAVSFGLLINELLSNTLKHAFPDGRAGEISISLHTSDEGQRELRVRDNGVGLSEDFDLERTNSLGFYLITILTKQLRGTVEVKKRYPGTEVIIRFREPVYKKRI